MLSLISGILQLIVLIFSKWGEADAAKRKKKEQLQGDLSNAIKTRDISALNAVTQRINRLR